MTVDIEMFERAVVGAIGVLVDHAPEGFVDERDGTRLAAVGAGGSEFNFAHLFRLPADPTGTLAWVGDRLGALDSGWMVQMASSHAQALGGELAAAGLVLDESLPLMVRAAPLEIPPAPVGLRIEIVRDPEALDRNTRAAALGFGAPFEVLAPVFPGTLATDDRVVFLNGYVDGTGDPQATAVGVVEGDLVGVFSITTQAAVRRRGIGAAMTWAAMQAGAERGAGTAVLQASSMGEPVYRRMGFETVAEHARFTRRPD